MQPNSDSPQTGRQIPKMQSIYLDPCLAACDDFVLPYCHKLARVDMEQASVMHTWVPAESDTVVLIKVQAHTLMYIPKNDMMYYAHPSFALGPMCPEHTVFVSQFVLDDGTTPRLLVFDMASDGRRSLQGIPAADRYRLLHERGAEALQHPQCIVQWVGELGALKDASFLKHLPHKVSTLMSLTSNPMAVHVHAE